MSKNRSDNDGLMGMDSFNERDGDDSSRDSKNNPSRGKKRPYDFSDESLDEDDARFIDSDDSYDMDAEYLDSEDGADASGDDEVEIYDEVSDEYLRRSFLYDADSIEDDLDDDFDDDFDEDFEQLPDDEFNELVPEIDDDGGDDEDEIVETDPSDDFDEMAADEDVYDGDEQI